MFDSYIGTIIKIAHPMQVRGWLPCHGQTLQIQFYTALYTLIQNTYGGDKDISFKLPDLRQKKEDGSYYTFGEIMKDGTPYIDSFICYEGVFPEIIN